MSEDIAGLVSVSWRRNVQTTVSDQKASPFPKLLKQDFKVALPNMTWVYNFTYMLIDKGWLYLCTFIDLFSCRVVRWAVSNTIDRRLSIPALRNAVANRNRQKRLVIHTDRGCQYTSWDFRREVAAVKGIQCMSRSGAPYDNVCAETIFKTVLQDVKVECVDSAHFKTRKTATDAIAEYMLRRMGILTDDADFIAVHDFKKPYFKCDNVHYAMCDQHLERELVYTFESGEQSWQAGFSNCSTRCVTSAR